MKLYYYFIASSLLVLAFFSCKKNELDVFPAQPAGNASVEIDAYVTDGTLYFPTSESFSKAIQTLHTSSDEALNNWEQHLGFVSAYTIFEQATGETEAGKEQEYMDKYPSLLFKSAEGELDVKVQAKSLLRFLNTDRTVYVGAWILKFTEAGEFALSKANQDMLSGIESIRENVPGKCYFFKGTPEIALDRLCGYNIPSIYLENEDGNRRSMLYHRLDNIIIPQDEHGKKFTIENWEDVGGRSHKKNVFGNWSDYNTAHDLEFNFRVGIVNETGLMNFEPGVPTGATIVIFNREHKGSAHRDDSKYVGYYGIYFKATDVPGTVLPYGNPIWENIRLNKHKTRGIDPNWNGYTCQ